MLLPSVPPIRTMLPSGIATLLCRYLADHPALAFTCVQGAVKFSSPKNHAQPVGRFDDKSVNKTGSGAVPKVTSAVKSAKGGSVALAKPMQSRRANTKIPANQRDGIKRIQTPCEVMQPLSEMTFVKRWQ